MTKEYTADSDNNIGQTLNRIRKKLLDLSRRNRLLNYRAGSRSLLIVNELPGQIFKTLVLDGRSLHFSPLPEPDVENEVSDTQIRNSGLLSSSIVGRIDSRLSEKSIDADQHLSTDVELLVPKEGEGPETKHIDNSLQTQLYARDLERRLKRIAGNAQTAIEESGTNILYLVIGFLEWYEDDNSDQKNRAPLILVPVSLERGKLDIKKFRYKYSLSYSGEDFTSNLSLAEKLKQDFGIVLPEIDDELEPTKYLAQVNAAIAEKNRWRVIEEIILGMFSFGKLLMYLDLDSTRWPTTFSITKHPIVRALLEGGRDADGNPYGETFSIDADPQAAAIPLVVDADTSQHSAIIDVLSGTNLVIEGPPGTGKSQTITNLIAVSLAQGKTVLFVSEKLAALEVVRRNLDRVSLGHFCLELHSHKTQKQKLLKDVEARLKKEFAKVESHDKALSNLNHRKKTLQSYVDVINEKYGLTEMTVHEIMWCAERARGSLGSPPRIQITNPKKVSREDIEQCAEALNLITTHWDDIDPGVSRVWAGYSIHNFYQHDEFDLEDLLVSMRSAVAELIQTIGNWPAVVGRQAGWTFGALTKLVAGLETIRNPPAPLSDFYVSLVSSEEARSFVLSFNEVLTSCADRSDAPSVASANPAGNLRSLKTALGKLSEMLRKVSPTKEGSAEVVKLHKTTASQLAKLEQVCKNVAEIVKASFPIEFWEIHELCRAASLAAQAPADLIGHAQPSMLAEDCLQYLYKAENEASELAVSGLALEERFSLEVMPDRETLRRIRHVLSIHEKKMFRFLSSDFRWAKLQLSAFTKDLRSHPRGTWTRNVDDILSFLVTSDAYSKNTEYCHRFGILFEGTSTNWSRLKTLLSWTDELRRRLSNNQLLGVLISRDAKLISSLGSQFMHMQRTIEDFVVSLSSILTPLMQTGHWVNAIKACGLPLSVEKWLLTGKSSEKAMILANLVATIESALPHFTDRFKKLSLFGALDERIFFGGDAESVVFPEIHEKLLACVATVKAAGKWADYCRAVQRARTLGLQEIINLIEDRSYTHKQLVAVYEYALYSSLAKTIIREHPLLHDFTRVSHEKVRAEFRELDKQILGLNQGLIGYQASRKNPPNGISSGPVKRLTDMGLIYHELHKKKRHVPIRQLVNRAGCALQELKPCFMMGPLSVAQYLAPGKLEFDLVIMDEASQVRPEEALGAIARGKQIVIVGDPKQLPPTIFFDRLGDIGLEDEEDETSLEDAESVLDICMQTYRPARRLQWHYRSEHESLINFSNNQFYDGELILFPSPIGIKRGFGIKHHYVKNALWENRRNKVEAEAVARAVLSHANQHGELSLGVATFNLQQRELIEDLIDRIRSANPVLDDFFEQQKADGVPFFVKNIENIQGDERDVIFISATYGPESSGRVLQRFGPINANGGWRRLNVIVTRAKKRTEVFTSMRSTDVIVSSESSLGVRALRAYLEYAENGGVVRTEADATGKGPDSPFEESVAIVLRQAGYSAKPQIGVAGYFIDIGVEHPFRPDEYVLGVECDGAMYHSALSARDRDRLRQDVLEHRGWAIHRIWSTDWFNNREAEILRLLQKVEQSIAEAGGLVEPEIAEVSNEVEYTEILEREKPGPVLVQESSAATRRKLSTENARRKLMDLYRNRILSEFPNQERGILRREMLEALLRNAPTTPKEFLEFVPLTFRDATDPNHMKFLPEILEILSQLED